MLHCYLWKHTSRFIIKPFTYYTKIWFTRIIQQTVLTWQLQKEDPCPLQTVQLFTLSACLSVISFMEHLTVLNISSFSSYFEIPENKLSKICLCQNCDAEQFCLSLLFVCKNNGWCLLSWDTNIWRWCLVTPDSRQ